MKPKINIIVEGEDEAKIKSAFEDMPELSITKTSESRGLVSGASKAVNLIAELVGVPGRVTDAILEKALEPLAGASIKVQYGDTIIEVTNANRSQVTYLLETAINAANEASKL